jgi:hypothetical protein
LGTIFTILKVVDNYVNLIVNSTNKEDIMSKNIKTKNNKVFREILLEEMKKLNEENMKLRNWKEN